MTLANAYLKNWPSSRDLFLPGLGSHGLIVLPYRITASGMSESWVLPVFWEYVRDTSQERENGNLNRVV